MHHSTAAAAAAAWLAAGPTPPRTAACALPRADGAISTAPVPSHRGQGVVPEPLRTRGRAGASAHGHGWLGQSAGAVQNMRAKTDAATLRSTSAGSLVSAPGAGVVDGYVPPLGASQQAQAAQAAQGGGASALGMPALGCTRRSNPTW
ncbi:hypothetical protein TSOC_010505 [Tetrabaena socialis]|uniref:Uncharacterized protein n=1 Tax=Tetrabaena socialis TaxID=47790 RepID=A0A2J7ZT69_9CHLO|nr:hypothetical protein TSOC_010505 [Tetrabaena socialis]|eukprot:PNH03430.1 hypothetical protein TSOC_010505 [Tetrabaena socialis]